jgi:hypothetical protein
MSFKAEQFTFFCNEYEWTFWERLLPRMAYAKTGMSVHELVDDALSFYTYAFSQLKEWNTAWEPWDFGPTSWNIITGFYDLTDLLIEVGETVDESMRNQRIYQLYLEQALGALEVHQAEGFGVNKHLRQEPALENIRSISSMQDLPKIFYTQFTPTTTAQVITKISPAILLCGRVEAKVMISEDTLRDFRNITQHFGISDVSAILVVLRQLGEFIPLSDSFTDSFREDLFVRRLNCRSLAARWVEELAITEAHCARADAFGSVLSERLACLHNNIPGGQSLTDFLANEDTLRSRDDTDFSAVTDLTEDERLMGDNLLF